MRIRRVSIPRQRGGESGRGGRGAWASIALLVRAGVWHVAAGGWLHVWEGKESGYYVILSQGLLFC